MKAVPVVRQAYAPDPDPEKVQAALALWRQALAGKLAEQRAGSGQGDRKPGTDPAAGDGS